MLNLFDAPQMFGDRPADPLVGDGRRLGRLAPRPVGAVGGPLDEPELLDVPGNRGLGRPDAPLRQQAAQVVLAGKTNARMALGGGPS